MFISMLLFGHYSSSKFGEDEEFKYKLLIVLLLSGAIFTLLLILGSASELNPISGQHSTSMKLFTAAAILLFAILRGRIHLVKPIAICYETACLFEYVSVDRSMSYYVRMKESNESLLQMAMTDLLTGLLNARAYYELCEQQIHIARRMNSTYSVLFVDLDHFKKVNDIYGHAIGDIVLKQTANCLINNLRKSDIVGRIGGEEFSIFLPDTDKEHAIILAEAIRRYIESQKINVSETKAISVTASICVSTAGTAHGSCISELQKSADMAMYVAKMPAETESRSWDDDLYFSVKRTADITTQ